MPERYPMDGSFESYTRLIRDAERGISEAREAIAWYRQYQELSRDVRVKAIPPPQPWHHPFLQPVPYAIYGDIATVVSPNWVIRGEPTRTELKELQRALDRMLPRSPVKCYACGTLASTGCSVCISAGRAKVEIIAPKPPYMPEGVHITSHQRIGDQIRNTYLDHLGAMFSDGSIDQAEFQARSDAAVKARTKEELESLIQDLPSLLVAEREQVVRAAGKDLAEARADMKESLLPSRLTAGICLGINVSFAFAFLPGISVLGVIVFSVIAFCWFSVLLARTFRKH